jgi:DNA-binding transcriptional LysR family regulator
LLAPAIAQFREIQPDIRLEIIVANEVSDLSLREADIAIRPAEAPAPYLLGRKLGRIEQGVYIRCQKGIEPPGRADLPWIGPSRAMAYDQLHSWMAKTGHDAACVCRMNTVLGMYTAVHAGMGAAVLPTYLAEAMGGLVSIEAPLADVAVDLWLLTHPDLRRTARVRAVLDYFASCELIRSKLAR